MWEANHVWLIYILVIWWTGFPEAFAATMTTLALPFLFALARHRAARRELRVPEVRRASSRQARLFGVVFATSSVVTPYFLGSVAGGIASGRVPAEGHGDLWTSWINPTSAFGGIIAVGTCATLAGVFLTAEAHRSGHAYLARRLRVKSMLIGAIHGPRRLRRPHSPVDRRTHPDGRAHLKALPLMVLSAMGGIATLVLLGRRAYTSARITAVTAVAAVTAGWGVGQYPWLLVDHTTIEGAAGAPATLVGLLVVVGIAAVLVIPALGYLYWLTQSDRWADTN